MSGRIGGAYWRKRWSNEQEAWHCGKDRFDKSQNREQWNEETVVMRIPRSRLAEVMALLKSAPTELI